MELTVTNDLLSTALALKVNVRSLGLRLCSETKYFEESLRFDGKRRTGKDRRYRFRSCLGDRSLHRQDGLNQVGGCLGLGQHRFRKLYTESTLHSTRASNNWGSGVRGA